MKLKMLIIVFLCIVFTGCGRGEFTKSGYVVAVTIKEVSFSSSHCTTVWLDNGETIRGLVGIHQLEIGAYYTFTYKQYTQHLNQLIKLTRGK